MTFDAYSTLSCTRRSNPAKRGRSRSPTRGLVTCHVWTAALVEVCVTNHATAVTPKSLNKFLAKITKSFYIRSRTAIPAEIVDPIVDLLNRGVSIAGIAPDSKTEPPGNGAATA